jgi:hypothetical protein
MKKLLYTILFTLVLSGNANSAEFSKEGEIVFYEQVTNDFLKNKTVTDLTNLGFQFKRENITTTEDSVQYHLFKIMNGGIAKVICFVDVKETKCKLP